MKVSVFVIYDSKVGAYLQPFFSQSKGSALRALQDLVDDVKHNFHKYAEDFTLFELGTWSDQDTVFDLYDTPRSVIKFNELKKVPDVN